MSEGLGLHTASLSSRQLVHELKNFYGKSTTCEELCKALGKRWRNRGHVGTLHGGPFLKILNELPMMETLGDFARPNALASLVKPNHLATWGLRFHKPATSWS